MPLVNYIGKLHGCNATVKAAFRVVSTQSCYSGHHKQAQSIQVSGE